MHKKLLVSLIVVVSFLLFMATAYGQAVDVTIPDASADAGSSIDIPVNVSDVAGLDVFSYTINLTFDQNVLDGTGVSVTGGVAEPWGPPTVADQDNGELIIAGAGVAALTGEGNLLTVSFDVVGNPGDQTLVDATVTFNEGNPAANVTAGTFTVNLAELFEAWNVEFPNAHRGIGACPLTGRVYVGNTSDKRINYFNVGNETGIPDGYVENEGWAGWLGPYGLDVADDGMVYVTTYGAGKSIFQITYDGAVTNILEVGENMRALTAYGAGVNTVVYVLENSGKVYKVTTTDGVTWEKTELFNSGHNASVAVSPDGNTLYTVGYNTNIKKWDAAGNQDMNFNQGLGAETASVIAVRLSEDGSDLYAVYNDIVEPDTAAFLGKMDPATGEVLASTMIGPHGSQSPVYGAVNAFDILDDQEFYWSSSAGYRGKAVNSLVDVPNRPPFAHAGVDQLVEINSVMTLDGSGSVDIDMDAITYAWSVVSAPEAVTFSDATAQMPTFTPTAVGDYVFELVVNDGALDSPPAQVTVSTFEKDFFYTYDVDKDRDQDVANWGIYSLTNRYSVVMWDSVGGVNGTGALRIEDGGWGLAMERPLNATPGTNFKISADVLVKDVNVPLYFRVSGLGAEPVDVEIQNFNTDFVTVELTGVTLNETGYVQILGETGGGRDTIWVDNITFDDDAELDTYTLSGTVILSDNPTDMSGAFVSIPKAGASDSTDENGYYEIPGLIAGTYDIYFSKFGYKDVAEEGFELTADATLDVTLQKNQPPVADAGNDTTGVMAGTYVMLDGSASFDPDGDSLTYVWTSADETVILATAIDNPMAGFRPTEINDYKFYLIVNDGTEDSAADSVMVSVTIPGMDPLGYEYVDNFAYLHAALGVVVDPEGKIWAGCYGYGSEKHLAVWNNDGTRPDYHPVETGMIGEDSVTTFGNSYGMAVDHEGHIYFSNASEHAVLKFDYRDGTPLGGIQLAAGSPVMDIDENGNIFVGTVVGDSVWIFDSEFNLLNSVYVEYIARDIGVKPDGSVIFVGMFNGTVKRYAGNINDGYEQIPNLPGPFSSPDGLGSTTDIGFDMQGRLWVTEEHTTWPQDDFIHIYRDDGTYRETIMPSEEQPWDNPRGLAFDHTLGDSLIYIVDFGSNNPWIQRWAIPGTHIPATFYSIAEVAEVDTLGEPVLLGEKVRIRGVITVANEFGGSGPAYIQDPDTTAAVAIYDYTRTLPDSVKIGDMIDVSGNLGFYNGLTEIDPPESFTILSSGHEIQPQLITCADLADTVGENYESQLVMIKDISTEVTEFPSNGNITVSDTSGSATMRIDKDTDIPGTAVQAAVFDAIGVVSQYDSQSPYWGGYQIMPRFKRDIPTATGVNGETEGLPKTFALYQNYPNPFNPVTTIKYDLPKKCRVEIQIFNILGQKVRTLVDEYQDAGQKVMKWNGLNDNDTKVASGTYIYMIKAADFKKTKRMTLLK